MWAKPPSKIPPPRVHTGALCLYGVHPQGLRRLLCVTTLPTQHEHVPKHSGLWIETPQRHDGLGSGSIALLMDGVFWFLASWSDKL